MRGGRLGLGAEGRDQVVQQLRPRPGRVFLRRLPGREPGHPARQDRLDRRQQRARHHEIEPPAQDIGGQMRRGLAQRAQEGLGELVQFVADHRGGPGRRPPLMAQDQPRQRRAVLRVEIGDAEGFDDGAQGGRASGGVGLALDPLQRLPRHPGRAARDDAQKLVDQVLLRGEVPVELGGGDAGALGDLGQRHVDPTLLLENPLGRVQDPVAGRVRHGTRREPHEPVPRRAALRGGAGAGPGRDRGRGHGPLRRRDRALSLRAPDVRRRVGRRRVGVGLGRGDRRPFPSVFVGEA